MINYTTEQIMFQLHNSADKMSDNKMLFSYRILKMMTVAKTSYKFGINPIVYIPNKRINISKSKLLS